MINKAYINIVFVLFTLGFISCENLNKADVISENHLDSSSLEIDNKIKVDEIIPNIDTSELVIIDSLDIAYNTICNKEYSLLKFNFYKRNNGNWEYHYFIDSIGSRWCQNELEFMDFNFDGVTDARFFTGTSARGSNEYYKVFIRDKNTNRFSIVWAEDLPPNLRPNPETKKVESIRFYGCTMFEEHIILENKLITEKSIEVCSDLKWTYRDYKYYNHNGELVKSYKDSIMDSGESRFLREP